MNIKQASRRELEDYAKFLLHEIERIVSDHRDQLPKFKHELSSVEKELYIRDRDALGVDHEQG